MKHTQYTTDQLISLLLTAKEALELGVAQHPRDFDHVIRHRIDIVVRSLTTVMEEADEDVSDEPVDAYGFRADQRLECTPDDAAAFRRNRWMFG